MIIPTQKCPKLLIFLFFIGYVCSQNPYTYKKDINILGAQVSGTANLSNFPILISHTDADLRSVSNGGKVESENGYDIVFTSGDCAAFLNHQIESYDPLTGTIVVWVRIPTLYPNSNTLIQMYYGNPLFAGDPSSSGTWSARYDGVWHLHQDLNDASRYGNNGVNQGSSNTSVSTVMADGQTFTAPNHWIELPNQVNRSGSFSYSAWFNTNNINRRGQRIIADDQTNASGSHALSVGDPGAGRIRFYIRGMNPVSLDSPVLISNNTWYHVTATYDDITKTKSLYVNGALVASRVVTGNLQGANGLASIGGEVPGGETNNRFDGSLNEVRSYNGLLSTDWIATEYNNQNSPSTFYSLSTEILADNSCTILPISLLSFSAHLNDQKEGVLNWSTASELNNDYFIIQRSVNGIDWEHLDYVDGAGTSNHIINYQWIDENPKQGVNYYKIQQIDFDGAYSFTPIRSINLLDGNQLVYPNPFEDVLYLSSDSETIEVMLYNHLGQKIHFDRSFSGGKQQLNLAHLAKGIYFLHFNGEVHRVLKK